MNELSSTIMNKYFKTIASVMVVFALLLSAFATPVATVVAVTSLETPTGWNTPANPDSTTAGVSYTETDYNYVRCVLEASKQVVATGESITLSWQTSGVSDITINGEAVSQTSGTKTITNLQQSTIFTLKAINDAGSSCTQNVVVTCLPPEEPKICELTLTKVVNKSTAVPGDELAYTITVKNIGDGDCTGGGVKIEDVLDTNLTYLRYSVSSNLTAGYGSDPVYTGANHTLHFNAGTLTPGEVGTVSVYAKVNNPTQCGDFSVKNQAKVTAAELNNFTTWVYSPTVTTAVDNDCYVPKPPTCTLTPATQTVPYGGAGSLNWTTTNATAATLTSFGAVSLNGATSTGALYATKTYTLTATGPDGQVSCAAKVTVEPQTPSPTCTLTPATQTVGYGAAAGLTWTTSNATDVSLSGFGVVSLNGATTTPALFGNASYKLTATGNGETVYCDAVVNVNTAPAPSCDLFTATPSTIMTGASTTLAWQTSNVTEVFINNGIGKVSEDGTIKVSPLSNLTYTLTAVGVNNQQVTCAVPVTVAVDPVPVCEAFTATPSQLPVGGGQTTLDWKVTNATQVSIAPSIGAVATTGSKMVNLTQSVTYTLTATDDNGDTVSCAAPVVVPDPEAPLTCADNVSFTASDYSIRRGSNTNLTWSTTDVDSVSISGINATALSGSQSVSPSSDTTYTLTAKRGTETVNCPVTIDVSTGGGGGGSASPRCELDISKQTIKAGESVTLTWDTNNVTEVTLTDSHGKELLSTDDYLASEKKEYFDGKLTVKPTRDTTYTLLAERGSRDEECTVKVKVTDSVVVLQTRDQQPLVSSISLSQVPYTGFEAGPFMTAMFYTLLVAWSLFIAYLLVARNRTAPAVAAITEDVRQEEIRVQNLESMKKAEAVRPDVFPASTAPIKPVTARVVPANLPTGNVQIGYASTVADVVEEKVIDVNPHQVNDAVVTELENRAHAQHALLSSDAVRHFISTTSGEVERNEALDAVIAEAKKSYPLEDGWIVINESRMQNVCEVCKVNETASSAEPFIPATVPEGTGSLAEAIVTGNIVAAYAMIGNRPMFALADAAADLDAVYRIRRGEKKEVSELLKAETEKLSDEKIKNMIAALTGALDGTYNDEASAVKMAIMKAVKEVA